MTKKHYIEIAAMLKHYVTSAAPKAENVHKRAAVEAGTAYARNIAHDLCEIMARDNSRFGRTRFLRACGVQS